MKKNYITGIILIIAGLILSGNELNVWNINLFFEGWWTIFIIIPGILKINKNEIMDGIMYLGTGTFLFLSANDIVGWNLVFPLVITFLGINIIYKENKNK